MRFGVFSFARAPYDALAQQVRLIEELGFTSAWVNDDLMVPSYADFEPWTLLAALARDTATIRLGTMVTAITFRHPSLLAMQVATLDHISGGRVVLGLGAGGAGHPNAAFSEQPWSGRERADRLEEQTALLGRLLSGESVTADGQYYPVTDAQVPIVTQWPRPPLIVAAHGKRTLRTVARHADGWNSLGGQPHPEPGGETHQITLAEAVAATKRLADQLDDHCQDIGRDPTTIRRSMQAVNPTPDPFASVDAFDEYVGAYEEIGIDEVIFYWPPIEFFIQPGPVPQETQARFERIASQRVAS